jgi:eukaryotic-like serine/threonine-protein kinase
VFIAGDQLQRAPVGGGSPVVIGPAQGGVDLSWGAKGMILMDTRFNDSLRVVSATGGDMRPASRMDRAHGEIGSAWPSFLPDGEHFLFMGTLRNSSGTGNIRLGRLGSLDSKLLGQSDGRVEYAPGGWVVFLRGKNLVARKLDLGAGKLTGEVVTLADGVRGGTANGHFSVSPSGVLAFSRESGTDAVTLREVNRSGTLVGPALLTGPIKGPKISPDGTRLLYLRSGANGQDGDVSVLDLTRGTDTRLTFTGGNASTPEWSPDGRRFAFVARPNGVAARIHLASVDGAGAVDSLDVPGGQGGWITQWKPDGSALLYCSADFHTSEVPLDGAGRAHVLGDPNAVFALSRFSPDGKWLAYSQGTMPNVQVFVQGVAAAGRWQISTAPAARAVWVRGGGGMVFEGFDGRLMEVDIDTHDGFRPGMPRVLFSPPLASTGAEENGWTCDATGQRFFLLTPTRARSPGNVEVVTDFSALVKRR